MAGLSIVLALLVSSARAQSTLSTLEIGAARALIISPHPDDATLAAGGLMQRIIRQGGSVWVVQMTGGDAFPTGVSTLNPRRPPNPASYRWYGSLREREAIHALRRLGVGRSRVRLLGYPDEGLCQLAGADRSELPFVSPYTARESPPLSEQMIRGSAYRGRDLVRELSDLLTALRPNLVVLPHCGDLHPDHCATHLLVHEALTDARYTERHPPRLLHYILHYPSWPSDASDAPLAPPTAGRVRDLTWSALPLTVVERTSKTRALEAYHSQMLVMPDFLKAFEGPSELFLEGDPPSPFPCWCNGVNISPTASGGQ